MVEEEELNMETRSVIRFANEKIKNAFENLKNGKFEDKEVRKWLIRAFTDLTQNAFSGIQVPKKLIPKEYLIYDIDNLWKYDLPKGWRVIYSIKGEEINVVSIILEWLDHKNYEKRFNY